MSIRVGILDQTPIYEGETAVDAFRHTIEPGTACRATWIPSILGVGAP